MIKLTNYQQTRIVALKLKGLTAKAISLDVFGTEQRYSSVQTFLKHVLNENVEMNIAGRTEKPKPKQSKGLRIFVIGDTQCKPGETIEHMSWIGNYIAAKRPDVIVHIGDHFDLPSLSFYDKGKRDFEGRRLVQDIEVGRAGLATLVAPFKDIEGYDPVMHLTLGNHEYRIERLANDMPELDGFAGYASLGIEDYGFTVHDFLKPVTVAGINFVHFMANPLTGKPYGGAVLNILKNTGSSFVMGHRQVLDYCIRPKYNGGHQVAAIVGACYPWREAYKGHTGNNHFRGCMMLNECHEGSALPAPVSLEYMEKYYG